ncbi:hypothetical protein G6F32_015150 [Rhizopus arrhizus]|nr:hypothetical protein G6F32_015150 [Rhizopus arrhizus]
MSGVVNIILRDQADGPAAMLQTGLSSRGDAAQYRLQAATGGLRGNGDRWFAGVDLHRVDHLAGDRRDWHAETSQYLIGAFAARWRLLVRQCAPTLAAARFGYRVGLPALSA